MKETPVRIIILFLVALCLGFVLGHKLTPLLSEIAAELKTQQNKNPAPNYQGGMHVYQLLFETANDLEAEGTCNSKDWESLPLVIKAGQYCIDGQLYTFNAGLIRLYKLGSYSQNFIIDDNNLSHILSSLSWITTHGNQNNYDSLIKMYDVAKSSKLSLTCGRTSNFSRTLLTSLGYETRELQLFSLDPKQESGNRSHIAFEVKDKNGQWIVADISGNHLFKTLGNKWMNGLDLINALKKDPNSIQFFKLATDPKFDATGFNADNYDYTFFIEKIYASDAQVRKWYQQVFQGIFFEDPTLNHYYYFANNDNEREHYSVAIESHSINATEFTLPKLKQKLYP